MYNIIKLENAHVVTKFISKINFIAPAKEGTVSSVLNCDVRNKMTYEIIITVYKTKMVNLDSDGNPKSHRKTKIEFVHERLSKK